MIAWLVLAGLGGGLHAAPASPAKQTVLFVELQGESEARGRLTEALIRALRKLPELELFAVPEVEASLGEEGLRRVRACPSDRCVLRNFQGIAARRAVLGSLEPRGAGARLELRLVDTASSAEPRQRLVRDLAAVDRVALETTALEAVADLFPEASRRSGGRVVFVIEPDGTEVLLDGTLVGLSPVAPQLLAAGAHTLELRRAGHAPLVKQLEVAFGTEQRLDLELALNRAEWPFWVGGSGLAAIGVGVVLGLVSNGLTSEWKTGCEGGTCTSGFTLARYRGDDTLQDNLRIGAGTALAIGGAAVLTALIAYASDSGADVPAPSAEASP